MDGVCELRIYELRGADIVFAVQDLYTSIAFGPGEGLTIDAPLLDDDDTVNTERRTFYRTRR